jgi:hypothetical protein
MPISRPLPDPLGRSAKSDHSGDLRTKIACSVKKIECSCCRRRRAELRRWAPTFLDAFIFQGVPAAAALMRAIDMLRDMNRRTVLTLPKSAPISFVKERWARHVLRGGGIDRRYYELCVLSELRNRLRAGDVWVVGSRRYRAFEERLISRETLKELERGGTLPIAVDADFERFIAARRALLNERLAGTDVKAKDGLLPDVTLDKGVLKITPIEKSTPPEAEALAARLYAMPPQHPDYRSPVGSGAMDTVHRLLHPSADG